MANPYNSPTERQTAGKADTSTFSFPIHKKSTRAVIAVGGVEHLPLSVITAEWEGFFTGRTQRIQ
jgi:hypothetical protein